MKRPLRVGLLYADDFSQPRSQRIGSLGLGYLAAWLQQEEPGTEVAIAISPADLQAPDLIGISAYTETLPLARSWARELKKWGVPLLLGGAHIASNPADLPSEFDAGIAGEGEMVLLELVRLVAQNAFTPERLRGIQGVTFQQAGQVVSQGRCPPIMDLDQLAHPDRALMFAGMRRRLPDFKPVLHVHTARGCPYRCSFCSAPLVNPQWRFHSPEWVVADLELIARQFPEATDVTFSDDLFTLKKSRLEELCRAIRSAGLHRRFFFLCSSRSNTLTPEMCRLMRDMNMLMISFGFEGASDHLIRDLKGVGTHQADYSRVLALCQRFGIHAHGNFITGSQHETLPDLQQTAQFVQAESGALASVYFSHMTPFPGTRVWDEARAAGLIPAELDFRSLNLVYEPGKTLLLNQHYPAATYATAWAYFKRQETTLNDRYYREQELLREQVSFERQQWPEELLRLSAEHGWSRLGILSARELFPLPDPHWCWLAPDPSTWPSDLDVLVLPAVLEQQRDPGPWLATLPPQLPVISLNHNAAFIYTWALLLLGSWEEGLYGLRQRQHLRYFTPRSLQRLLRAAGYQLAGSVAHVSQWGAARLPAEVLRLLNPDPAELQAHSHTTCWVPLRSGLNTCMV
jgi:anaerobic magnesium-protoporphyrin IX monomethyl ester cyclase